MCDRERKGGEPHLIFRKPYDIDIVTHFSDEKAEVTEKLCNVLKIP